MKVLLIAAASRSGCTILGNILGHYNGAFAAGELTNLWERGAVENRPCGCGEPFGSCSVWQSIVTDAFGELTAERAEAIRAAGTGVGTLDFLTRRLPGRKRRLDDAIAEYATSLMALVRGIDDSQQPSIIIDAGSPAHAMIYSSVPGVDLRILHLVRDVRGVAYSTQRRKLYDPSTENPLEMERFRPMHIGAIWAALNLAFEIDRGRARNYRRIRYEDFTADPQRVVNDIAHWCELDVGSSPFINDRQVGLGTNHIVSGNPSRFGGDIVDIVPDDEWRLSLPKRDRAALTAAFGGLLIRYGYPLGLRWVGGHRARPDWPTPQRI